MKLNVTCRICNMSKIVNGQKQFDNFKNNHKIAHNIPQIEMVTGEHFTFNNDVNNRPELITGDIKNTIAVRH